MILFLYKKPLILHATIIFFITFLIRFLVFHYYIYPNGFYQQADSGDYHLTGLLIKSGYGMFRPDIKQPIFWRTPGYPFFLSLFYQKNITQGTSFADHADAHWYALFFQIIFSSFIPLILLFLAYAITESWLIAWIAMLISVVHTGFILASVYLLSEGPSLILFYLFLLLLFKIIQKKAPSPLLIGGCAFFLALYTWIRPMGEWIGILTIGIIVIFLSCAVPKRIGAAILFGLFFFALLAPWYIRNYQYTHKLFFNPTIGTYVNCFCVPKVLRRVHGVTLKEALHAAQANAAYHVNQARIFLEPQGLYASNEECKKYAFPIIMQYPHYVLYDWIVECIKTTFDLYSYQLVALANNEYTWDPIEEFLVEKICGVLWARDLSVHARIVAWGELFWMILLWTGLMATAWHILRMIFARNRTKEDQRWVVLWIAAALISLFTIALTGGFGYARLRLPIEPLLIIFGVSGVVYCFKTYSTKEKHL